MNKTTIPIKGMHCRSCEILIEERLKEITGIKSVRVSYKKNEADIYSKHQLNMGEIKSAVIEAGYEVGVDDSKSWVSLDPSEYADLAKALVLLLILYYIAQKFGLFNINTGSTGNPSNLFVVFLIGLTAGLSTCMALVGGLVLGISARHSEKHPEATPVQKFRPHMFFNVGRVLSYVILGGVIGLAGKAFQLSGPTLGILTIIVGIVMLILGAQLTGMFPKLSNGGLTLPSGISKLLGIRKHHEREYSHLNSACVGALTFFLPCGFTQAMQLYAMSTGSFWYGAAIMGTFAIGTAPGLLGIGGLTSLLKGAFAKKFFKFTGLLVAALAIFNISNGYNLTGWKVSLPSNENNSAQIADDPNVSIKDGVQVVSMDQLAGGYKPNKFTIKKNIPVKWVINSKKADSCAASIYVPKLGIKRFLESGENIIEFTPKESGDIKFSCSMGMYSGKFIVIDDDSASDKSLPNDPSSKDTSPSREKIASGKPSNQPAPSGDVQIIKTTYVSAEEDIVPNEFSVKAGKPVRFEILAEEDGEGCMGSVAVPGLANRPDFFEKGNTIVFEFTPTEKGVYDITCAMGVPRGTITVT